MTESYMNRRTSSAIKGIALICMFIHHFFTFPEWYVDGISYPYLMGFAQYLRAPLRICVPLFAFLTGYFYQFSRQKTLRYALGKILDLLIPHGVVCFLMTALALVLGVRQFSLSGFVLEVMGLDTSIMMFSWYVAFYCAAMLMLPVVVRLSSGNPVSDILLLLILPAAAVQCVMMVLTEQFQLNAPLLISLLSGVYEWFPCVTTGFLAARYRLFETYFDSLSQKFSSKTGKTMFHICLIGIGFGGRLVLPRFCFGAIQSAGIWNDLVFTMDIFYAPMVVYGMAKLLESCKFPAVSTVLAALGKQSLYMWFLHAVFFNPCREFTQPLIYAVKFPPLVLALALAVCYGLALLMAKLINPLLRLKNKLL